MIRYRTIKYFIIFLLVVSPFYQCFTSGNNQNSNLNIINTALKSYSENILSYLKTKNIAFVQIIINSSDASRYFEQILAEEVEKQNMMMILSDSLTSHPRLNILIKELNVFYSYYEENDDSLLRKIVINISSSLSWNGILDAIPGLDFIKDDIISREDINMINSSKLPFTNPTVPERPGSFLNDIIQPLAVISAAVITVVLLFEIRSK